MFTDKEDKVCFECMFFSAKMLDRTPRSFCIEKNKFINSIKSACGEFEPVIPKVKKEEIRDGK